MDTSVVIESKKKRSGALVKRFARWRRALTAPQQQSDIELIQASGLFDTRWYLQKYPDVAEAGVDPLTHYISDGAREGRKTSPHFDTRWYVNTYPDASTSNLNPLVHYIRNRQGRLGALSELKALTSAQKADASLWLASGHFDADWYAKVNNLGKAGRHAALHYLQFGAAKAVPPSPSFDGDRYLKAYPDVRDAGANPLVHYIRHGEKEGRTAFTLHDPLPPVLNFDFRTPEAVEPHGVDWITGPELVGDDLSGVLTLGKSPVGLLPRNAAGLGLPKQLGQVAEIFCRLTGRASTDLAGIKGSRKKVRLMISDTPPKIGWCARSNSSRKATGSCPSVRPGWDLTAVWSSSRWKIRSSLCSAWFARGKGRLLTASSCPSPRSIAGAPTQPRRNCQGAVRRI